MKNWKNWVGTIVMLCMAWYGLKMYVGINLARNFSSCIAETRPVGTPPYSEAQMRTNLTRVIDCVEVKSSFVDRLFFNRDEVVASMKFENK